MAVSDCIQFICLGISIASFVYICKIFKLTKVDLFDKKLENPDKYFDSSNQAFFQKSKQCKCGEEIVKDSCTEEELLSGCVEISLSQNSDKQKFLRFLLDESKCKNYEDQIKEGNKKLNEIFKLNISGIHAIVTGLIIVVILSLAVIILITFIRFGSIFCGENAVLLIIPCLPCILIISYGSGITNLVLFIILLVKYYDGETRTYVEFLECKIVNRNQFSEKFRDIEELKLNFTVFMTLHVIYSILNFIISGKNSSKKERN